MTCYYIRIDHKMRTVYRTTTLRAILFTGLFCFLVLQLPVETALGYSNVTPAEVKTMLDTEEVYLLDVRTLEEYLAGHIPGAYLIPHTELESRICELPSNLSQPIIVYCRSGGRSAIAANLLDSWGYTDVRNMAQGFSSWSYAVESGAGSMLGKYKANCISTVRELPVAGLGLVIGIAAVLVLVTQKRRP